MRNILLTVATVAGLGLLGTSGALAAPAAGAAIRDAATATTSIQDARFCKWRHREHSRRWKDCRDRHW